MGDNFLRIVRIIIIIIIITVLRFITNRRLFIFKIVIYLFLQRRLKFQITASIIGIRLILKQCSKNLKINHLIKEFCLFI